MLKTKRLLMRPFCESDRNELVPLLQNPAFMEFSDSGALSEAEAHFRFDQILEFSAGSFGKNALILQETSELIGYCGTEPFDLNGRTEWELGYRIITQHRGKGLAAEAGQAVIDYCRLPNLFAYTDPMNTVSIRVLLRLGFVAAGDFNIKGKTCSLFELPPST